MTRIEVENKVRDLLREFEGTDAARKPFARDKFVEDLTSFIHDIRSDVKGQLPLYK